MWKYCAHSKKHLICECNTGNVRAAHTCKTLENWLSFQFGKIQIFLWYIPWLCSKMFNFPVKMPTVNRFLNSVVLHISVASLFDCFLFVLPLPCQSAVYSHCVYPNKHLTANTGLTTDSELLPPPQQPLLWQLPALSWFSQGRTHTSVVIIQ